MNKKKIEKPYVGEVLSYENNIQPYKLIHIYSGVGSGKNTFVENFDNLGIKYLELTSRRAKVNQACDAYKNTKNLSRFIDYNAPRIINEFFYKYDIVIDQHSDKNAITTYGMLDYYFNNVYNPNDEESYVENIYDCIICDEVHSVILDSNYQEAVYTVDDLINRILYNFEHAVQMRCKHLILMTATPDVLNKHYDMPGSVSYDLRDSCRNLYPKKIHFIDKHQLKNIVSRYVINHKKTIYFANDVWFPNNWIEGTKIAEDQIVCSFSDKGKRDLLDKEDPDALKRMEQFDQELINNKKFLDGIDLLITTSRYKEGIDIDENISAVFVDQHNESDVRQMAGRVRGELENLYMIVDANQFGEDKGRDEIELGIAYQLVDLANKMIKECKTRKEKLETIKKFEKASKYLKYSYVEDVFVVYDLVDMRNDYYKNQKTLWDNCETKYENIVQKWYPNSEVEPYVQAENPADLKFAFKKRYLEEFIDLNYELDKEYNQSDLNALSSYVNRHWGKKMVNPVLKHINLKVINTGKGGTKRKIIKMS